MYDHGLTLDASKMKIVEFANRVDPDEVAHNEPRHLDQLCLPSTLLILSMIYLELNIF